MTQTRKVALVTGAGSGIGRAVAVTLLNNGFDTVLAGRRLEALEATAKLAAAAQSTSLVVATDVGNPDSVDALFAQLKQRFGRLDLLFNNAGIGAPPVALEDLSYAQWKAVVDANLTGAFLCTQRRISTDEGAGSARWPHHQQRLDLGPRAATKLCPVYRDQARHHRTDQVVVARWPQVRHRRAARSTSATRRPTSRAG